MNKNKFNNQLSLFDKYCIFDKYNTSQKPYLSNNNMYTNNIKDAKFFDTKKEAEDYIQINKWNKWAIIIRINK